MLPLDVINVTIFNTFEDVSVNSSFYPSPSLGREGFFGMHIIYMVWGLFLNVFRPLPDVQVAPRRFSATISLPLKLQRYLHVLCIHFSRVAQGILDGLELGSRCRRLSPCVGDAPCCFCCCDFTSWLLSVFWISFLLLQLELQDVFLIYRRIYRSLLDVDSLQAFETIPVLFTAAFTSLKLSASLLSHLLMCGS